MGEEFEAYKVVGRVVLDGQANVEKGLATLGSSMSKFGGGLTKYVTLPIIAAVGVVSGVLVKMGKDFDDGYDALITKTGAEGKALDSLKKDFKEVAKVVPESFEKIGNTVGELSARMNLTGKPLQDLSIQITRLGEITKTEIASLIPNVTRVFGDWSISTAKQSGVMDYLYKVATQTGIGVDKLSENVVKFGAPLRQMGFDFETSSAMIGKWEKEGVNAELVLGSLRIGLTRMAKEGITDTNEALWTMIDRIKSAGSTGEATKLAMEMFGAKAGPDMAAAIREGRFELEDLVSSLKNSKVTINETATSTEDFTETWTKLKNKIFIASEPIVTKFWEGLNKLAIMFEEKLVPAIEKMIPKLQPVMDMLLDKLFPILIDRGIPLIENLVEKIGDLVQKFSELTPKQQDNVLKWIGIAAAAGPVLVILGKMVTVFTQLKSAMSGVLGTAGMVATVTLLMSKGVATVGENIGATTQKGFEWKRLLLGLIPIQGGSEMVYGFRTILGIMPALINKQIEWNNISGLNRNQQLEMSKALREGNTEMVAQLSNISKMQNLKTGLMFKTWSDNIKEAMTSVGEFFTTTIPGWWTTIETTATTIWTNIQTFFSTTWEKIKGIFSAAWDNIWQFALRWVPFLNLIVENWDKIVGMFQSWWSNIINIFTTAFNWISGITNSWNENIRGFFVTVWDGIAGFFTNWWNTQKTNFNTAIEFIKGLFEPAFTKISNIIKGIFGTDDNSGIRGFYVGLWKGITEGIESFKDGFIRVFDKIADGLRTPINKVIDLINGMIKGAQTAINGIAGALNNIKITIPDWVGKIIPGLAGQSWSPNITVPNLPTIPHLANGGTITRSGMALVGENGPEFLSLPKGAQVSPNVPMVNNYYITSQKALDEAQIRREIDSLSRELALRWGMV